MENKQIEIRLITTWPSDDIVQLYKAAGWWKDSYDPAGIPQLIKGSFAFAVAFDTHTKKTIGMGRVISDGTSDAYIQDFIVLPAYRRQDIGKKIAHTLIQYCRSKGITWIGLIAEPGSTAFYKILGFQPMEQHIPMLYQTEK